jgi:hypothetical protein
VVTSVLKSRRLVAQDRRQLRILPVAKSSGTIHLFYSTQDLIEHQSRKSSLDLPYILAIGKYQNSVGLEYSTSLRASTDDERSSPVDMLIENGHSDSANALQLSQQANAVLSKPAPTTSFFPLSLVAASETPDSWTDLERVFLACMRTGDDESAHLALERLAQRFGPHDERVMGLRGLYQEAEARNDDDLEKILGEYEDVLSEKPMNVVRIMVLSNPISMADISSQSSNGGLHSYARWVNLKLLLRRLLNFWKPAQQTRKLGASYRTYIKHTA